MQNKKLTKGEQDQFLSTLESRFEKNMQRHSGIKWEEVEKKLKSNSAAVAVLKRMEDTGGEPDVVSFEKNKIIFCDCSPESPKERRSLCYDRKALNSRKENKPVNSAVDLANEIGIEILSEQQYRMLQEVGKFDLKTSSWVKTPEEIRDLGGAIFCDRRYDKVFLYHNGADSYYAARGFRGFLTI